jgi:hypothetical protein
VTAARVGWAVLGTILAVSAAFVSIRYGISASIAAVLFVLVPFVPWRPLRTPWIPLVVLVAYTVWPIWPPLFSAGLGWLTGIAAVRVRNGPEDPAEPRRLGMRILGFDNSRPTYRGRARPRPAPGDETSEDQEPSES